MANRRSLGAAAALSPEKLAFIQGTPPEARRSPKIEQQAVETSDTPLSPQEKTTAQVEPSMRHSPRRSRTEKHPRHDFSAEQREDLFPGIANLLVPLTTRLRPTTHAALRRAGLEQKLRGRHPATVQEIAEEAIQTWLKDAGYTE